MRNTVIWRDGSYIWSERSMHHFAEQRLASALYSPKMKDSSLRLDLIDTLGSSGYPGVDNPNLSTSDKMVAVTYRPWARESTMQNAQPVVSCYIPGCVLDFIRAPSPTLESLDFRVATRTNKCGYNHLAIILLRINLLTENFVTHSEGTNDASICPERNLGHD